MDQSSLKKTLALGENESFIRRCFRALGGPAARTRRSQTSFAPASPESLEVRQVLSGAPLGSLAAGFHAREVPPDVSVVELTEAEEIFVDSALQQIEQSIRDIWILGQTGVANRTSVSHGTISFGQTPPVEDKVSDVSQDAVDSLPPLIDEEASEFPEITVIPVDPADIADASPPVIDDFFVPPVDQPLPDVVIVPDDVPLIPEDAPPVPPALPVRLPLQMPWSPDALQVHFEFEWNDHRNEVEVQLPNETTLIVKIRGSVPQQWSAAKLQLLEDRISEATVTLVQSFAPGTSVRVSLFKASTDETINDHRAKLPSSFEPAANWSDTNDSGDVSDDILPESVLPSLEVTSLDAVESTFVADSTSHLDIVFESIDSVLFAAVDGLSTDVPLINDGDGSQSAGSNSGSIVVEAGYIDPESGLVVSSTLSNSLQIIGLTEPFSAFGNASATITPSADERTSDRSQRQQKAPAASVLRLLFDEQDSQETPTVLDSRISTGNSSLSASTQSEQPTVRRQRVSQRDSSNASLLAFWQDEENTLPPIPSSDGAPREVQLAERSRGPPLLHSARDDLLTDYEAPASLLERLRYSISPRGPSLVTVDVQLPELMVLFGAES